jgi:hypothetical protein
LDNHGTTEWPELAASAGARFVKVIRPFLCPLADKPANQISEYEMIGLSDPARGRDMVFT